MKKSRALLISAGVLVLLTALYALAGFVLLPRYVLREAPNWLKDSGHRLSIREFRFNPFTLDAAAGGVAIEDAAGKPVFAAATASADLEWMSLARRAPVLASVQVTQPQLHVEIDGQGRVNLAQFARDDGQPSSGLPRFYVASLVLSEGSIDFADRRENYSTRFEQLAFRLSALSTLEAGTGSYALTAETPQGARLDWQGDVSMQPIAVSGKLAVTGVALPALWPYLDQWLAAPPVSGRAELQLPHRFLIHEGRPQLLLDGASAKLTDLALRGPQTQAQASGTDKPAAPRAPAAAAAPDSPSLKLGTLALSGVKLDLLARDLSAELLQMNGLNVALRRNANGSLDIAQLLRAQASQAGPAAAAPAKPSADASGAQGTKDWAVNVARTELRQGSVQLHDQLKSVELGLDALGGHIDNLALGGSRDMPFELQAKLSSGGQLQWQGGLTLEPLGVAGRLALEAVALPPLSPYLDEVLAVPLTSGRADAQLPHRLAMQDGTPRFTLQDASATLSKVVLGQRAPGKQAQADEAPGLAFDRFSARGVNLDLDGHQAGAKLLRVSGLSTALHREADGTLNLSRLVKTASAEPATPPAPTAQRAPAGAGKAGTATAAAPQPDWTVNIARAELTDGTLAFSDAASGIGVTLEKLGARVQAYSSRAKAVSFNVAAGVRGGGRLDMNGRLTPPGRDPLALSGRIEAAGLPVALLQPLVGQNYRLKLASGEATLAGDLQVGGKDAKVRYAGSLSIDNVAVNEAALKPAADGTGARLLGWKSFGTDKLTLTLSPDRLDMDELRLVAPVGQLAIAPDRSINFGRAFRPAAPAAEEKAADKPASPEPAAAANAAPADEQGGFAFDIRRLRVSDGKLDFSDRSLALDFSIAIQELGGVFNGLSSDRDSRSQFSLEGKVGEFGFARLTGGLNPYGWRDNTTLRAEFRNVDLQKVSPYSVTFAGYSIASGRLSLDLRYRINKSLVEGDNHAVFDQLTLGPKMESARAMDLPIEMAISLLKDDNGRIDIAIPVTGSLDDPQFNYGELIRKAIGTVISRIVTAPFRALASLFGGGSKGEEAGNITFEPGQSRLLPPEREKLQRVAQGLEKRPELKVAIPGRADSQLDAARLRREALTREIAKRSGFDVAEDESAGGVSIADARTRTAIRELYAERFGKAELDKQREQAEADFNKAAAKAEAGKLGVLDRLKNLASGEPQVTNPRPFYGALMRRLRENQPLPQDALEQLAQARAQSIADALKQSGVAEDRITTSTVATTADAQAKEITVELSLAKR